jgi:hypothetical protein
MKMVIRLRAPSGASVAVPTERIVPSAGETIVSSPPSGNRSGSRKNWRRKSDASPKIHARTERPSPAASAAAAAGGRRKG